jgi:translation initiation factor IF-1
MGVFMKIIVLIILTITFSASILADDNCNLNCNSDANQMGLMCQKMRQNCLKVGTKDSIKYEMCLDDVSACLQNGKSIFESCIKSCQEENQKL